MDQNDAFKFLCYVSIISNNIEYVETSMDVVLPTLGTVIMMT